jgi:hypothetical protein
MVYVEGAEKELWMLVRGADIQLTPRMRVRAGPHHVCGSTTARGCQNTSNLPSGGKSAIPPQKLGIRPIPNGIGGSQRCRPRCLVSCPARYSTLAGERGADEILVRKQGENRATRRLLCRGGMGAREALDHCHLQHLQYSTTCTKFNLI